MSSEEELPFALLSLLSLLVLVINALLRRYHSPPMKSMMAFVALLLLFFPFNFSFEWCPVLWQEDGEFNFSRPLLLFEASP